MYSGNKLNFPCDSVDSVQSESGMCGYAPEAINYILEKTGLNKGMILADIESGTGILAENFLKDANTVYCIERNRTKRQIAAEKFWRDKNFREMNGDSVNTLLGCESVDVITCKLSLSLEDQFSTIREFKRVLKSQGWLVIIQNSLSSEEIYDEMKNRDILQSFYPSGYWERVVFPFVMTTDYTTLPELLYSSGYTWPPEKIYDLQIDKKNSEIPFQIEASTIVHIGQPCY